MLEKILSRNPEKERLNEVLRSRIERLEIAYMEAMDKCNIPLANSIWKELIDVRKLNKQAA